MYTVVLLLRSITREPKQWRTHRTREPRQPRQWRTQHNQRTKTMENSVEPENQDTMENSV